MGLFRKRGGVRRRRPEWRLRLGSLWQAGLERETLWGTLLIVGGALLLTPTGRFFGPEVEIGDIAGRDYLASRDVLVPDEEATEEQRRRASEAVLPVYDFDPLVAPNLDAQLIRLFQAGRGWLEASRQPSEETEAAAAEEPLGPESPGLYEALAPVPLSISEETARLLARREFSPELEDRVRGLAQSALVDGVVDNKGELLQNRLTGITLRNRQTGGERLRLDLYDYRGRPDEVEEFFGSEIRRWSGWGRNERALLTSFLVENVPPNVYLNRTETASRRESAAEQAEQVFRQIREGQVIVRKGDQFDAASVKIVGELEGSGRQVGIVGLAFASLLLMGFIVLFVWMAVRMEAGRRSLQPTTFGGIALMLLAALFLVKVGLVIADALAESFAQAPFDSPDSYRFAIPFAALSLIVSLFYGRPLGLVTGVAFAASAGRLVSGDAVWGLLYVMVGSLAAVYSLDRLKQRSAVTRAGLTVAGVNGATALMLAGFDELPGNAAAVVGWEVALALLGGILVAAVAAFAVPILEGLLAVTTDIKLIELSDTNLPLLRRLAFETPGTFQHSLMVANLAKVGCEAIGANSVLAYTAGLYHDVGKLYRPQYFAENQPHGVNPHDKLTPSMSSLIVISHVRDGVELAMEHRLPEPLIDAIREHHGSRKLTFFYERALERHGGDSSAVPESDYRYPGPKPQSKEMGVLMLADGIEAASRVLRNPSPARIRNLIQQILDDCLGDHQLDETELTQADLREVIAAFCRVLESIYHKRVEYPGFDFNRDERELRLVEGGGGPP